MVEHMLFKGTEKRNAGDIVREIEDVGGSMNAYTSRELTSYHVHLLKDNVPLALDVLADMYKNSSFSDEEIERERGVIIQEIGMCNDTPDDVIFDLHFETAYPDQSFGAPILGQEHKIENMTRATLLDHVSRFYSAGRTVISAAGNIDHETLIEQCDKLFRRLSSDSNQSQIGAVYEGGEMRLSKELEQSHFIIGFEGLSRLNDDAVAAQALSTLLGGGMSSRLFQEVREKRGLVYSIFSFHSGYQDTGHFGIYAGTSPEKMGEIVPVVCDEILKITADIHEDELERAKAQLKANLLMGREQMMSRADGQAKHLLFRDEVLDISKRVATIEALDVKKIRAVAKQIFSSRPTLSALGPLDNLEDFDMVQKRLAA